MWNVEERERERERERDLVEDRWCWVSARVVRGGPSSVEPPHALFSRPGWVVTEEGFLELNDVALVP
jgi:hypothetical protein